MQDGVCSVYQISAQAGAICGVVRHEICPPPYSYAQRLLEVPEVLHRGHVVPVQGPLTRSGHNTLRLCQNVETGGIFLRNLAILILLFLDDWLLRHKSPEVILQHLQIVLDLTESLAILINLKKSLLIPR